MEIWQKDMENKLEETYEMVKRMYQHLFGTEEYKDGSLMVKISIMESKIDELEKEQVERNASIKTTKNIMRILWAVIGVLATAFGTVIMYIIKHFVK